MADGKKQLGSFMSPPPIGVWNDMVEAGQQHRRSQRNSAAELPTFAQVTDVLWLKNTTGSQINRGQVVEVGTMLLTSWTNTKQLICNGDSPAPDGTKGIAVALRETPASAIEPFQISGVCLAKVAVNHAQHYWADVSSSNTTLQTKWHGRAEILQRETGSSGTKWALVRLGQMFRGPIKGVIVSTITAGSSGSVRISWGGATSSPSNTVTAWLDWMHNGRNGAAGAECLIHWFPDQQKYVITELEC